MTSDPLELFVRFGLPVLVFLAGCFVIAWAVRGSQARQRWPGATATVTGYEIEEDGGGEGSAYRAVVHFSYNLDGRTIETKGPVASADWSTFLRIAKRDMARAEQKSPVDSAIEIIYDPHKPQVAMPAARRAVDPSSVLFGLMFMGIGGGILALSGSQLAQLLSGLAP